MANQREQRFERRMSDSEALMWNVEKDPWLNPNGASVSVLDQPVDVDRFTSQCVQPLDAPAPDAEHRERHQCPGPQRSRSRCAL